MSWDGVMMRLPKGSAMADLSKVLPADWKPPAIGSAAQIFARFEDVFPGQQHTAGQSCIEGDAFWIEFNYREKDAAKPIESIGVRSNAGAGAMAAMRLACDAFDVRLVDCQTGEFADFSEATNASMQQFSEWRDRALGQSQ